MKCGYVSPDGLVCAREKGHAPFGDFAGHRTAEFIKHLAEFDAATPAGETTDARVTRAEKYNAEHNLP